jgi:hypothetical protein
MYGSDGGPGKGPAKGSKEPSEASNRGSGKDHYDGSKDRYQNWNRDKGWGNRNGYHHKGGHHKGGHQKGDNRFEALMGQMAQLSLTVANMATAQANAPAASAPQAPKPKDASASKQYGNAKRSLQKKRSALLGLFGISADPTFSWLETFNPEETEKAERVRTVRENDPEVFDRLVKGIRGLEKRVLEYKRQPANASEQPLHILPWTFGHGDGSEPVPPA